MTIHEHQSSQADLDRKLLKIEAVSPDDPARIDITTDDDGSTKQLDIFIGGTDDLAESAPDDPGRFTVIDLRNMPRNEEGKILYDGQEISPSICYLMVQPASLDWSKKMGYKGIRAGEVVDMGRKQEKVSGRFNFTPTTSANHFTIAADTDGTLLLGDHHSTNGTSYQIVEEAAKKADDEVEEVTKERILNQSEPANDGQIAEQILAEEVIDTDLAQEPIIQESPYDSNDVKTPDFVSGEPAEQQVDHAEDDSTDAVEEIKDTYETDEALLQAARLEYKNQIQKVIDEFNETIMVQAQRQSSSLEDIEASVNTANQVYDTSLEDLSQLLRIIDNGGIDPRELNVKLRGIQDNIGYVRTQFMRSHESLHDVRRTDSTNEAIDNSTHLLARKQAEFTDFMGAHGQEIEAAEDTVVLRNQMNATQEAIQEVLEGLRTSESGTEDIAYTLTKTLGIIAEVMTRANRDELGLLLRMLQSLDISSVRTNIANSKSALDGIRGISVS